MITKELDEKIKQIKTKRYTSQQIKDIGKSWSGHPCQGYNQAIDDVIKILKGHICDGGDDYGLVDCKKCEKEMLYHLNK